MLRLLASQLDKSDRSSSTLWILLPLAFGLLSLFAGQDANWDLQNYHLYNPYALLTGRIGHDLAPAGLQTYFNPLLDIPYYWMSMNLSPMAVAFIMGTFHGLNFLLLHGIVRWVVPADTSKLAVFLLALSGCLGASFISELGSTMGDNSTALFILGGLLLLARNWPRLLQGDMRSAWICAAAGLVMGLGVGLKLTNAPYAVGTVVALATVARPKARRLFLISAFSLGTLAGIATTAGYWFGMMVEHFGNPLFPQFNSIFQSELASQISVADTRWRPTSAWEAILFPYVFTLSPHRFGELAMVQVLWPAVYTLFALWLAHQVYRWAAPSSTPRASQSNPGADLTRFVLTFLVASYAVWMAVFSIGRYAIVMEMLLPVTAWIILHQLAKPQRARKLAAWLIGLAVAITLIRFETWGNAGFSQRSYAVDVPTIEQPEGSTVLILASPMAWILPHFPPALAFVSLGNFPESKGYWHRAKSIIESRNAGLYAIVPAVLDARANSIRRLNDWTLEHGIRVEDRTCTAITWTLKHLSKYKMVTLDQHPGNASSASCAFELPPEHRRNVEGENLQIVQSVSASIAQHGMSLIPETCTARSAYIGTKLHVYQFCRARKSPP